MKSRAEDLTALIELLRKTADLLEEDGNGGLTGVVIVAEGLPGRFVSDDALTGTWVSMQGGRKLYKGLFHAANDIARLRTFKEGQVQ